MSLIEPMSLAALAAGADGIIVEVHYNPAEALCDKDQAMSPVLFTKMMNKLRGLKEALADRDPLGRAGKVGPLSLAVAGR